MLAKEALAGRESVRFFEAAQVCSQPHAKKPSEILPVRLTIYLLVQMNHAHSSAHSPFSSQGGKGTSGRGPKPTSSEPGKNV